MPPVLTIDGPTASGKGTVAQCVAAQLGFHYLDSGALYRLIALASLRRGIAPDRIEDLAELARILTITCTDGETLLEGVDVSKEIRTEEVGQRASIIAAYPLVRAALTARQRAWCAPPGLVADGRDMGTVIFPDACLKIFLTASREQRAQRRYQQLIEKGFAANIARLLRDLTERDARDAARAISPLIPAAEAKILDTSHLSVEQAVNMILEWWQAALKNRECLTLNSAYTG